MRPGRTARSERIERAKKRAETATAKIPAKSTCRSRGCDQPPWPSFDGVCFDHGMFPETVRT